MNNPFTRFLLLTVLIMLGVAALANTSHAQVMPLDYNAVFKTHVPHFNSNIGSGGAAGSGQAQASLSTTFSGIPYIVGPTAMPTSTYPEAEEQIAVDPNDSSNLFSAISDFALRGGYNTTKYAFFLDGVWTEGYVPLINSAPATSDPIMVWQANSDPVTAVDKFGNVYLSDLYFNASNNANGLYVSVGHISPDPSTGGMTFDGFTTANTFTVASNLDPATSISEDKEWIAVDNSSNQLTPGNVYVSWTRFIGNSDMIVFSRSINQGATWTTAKQISNLSQNGAVQGSQVVVGPNGEVYVVYEVFYTGGKRMQFLAKSTNGGVTFSTPSSITPYFNELSFNSTYRKNSFASLAASPAFDGSVYAVYADQPSKTAGAEVRLVRSTNSGVSFSAPVTINDKSTGQQFMPSVAVDSLGIVHASWFDTRNSAKTTSKYDIYATYSKDRGTVFGTNARVTSTLVDAGRASFIGDYAGIAAAGGYAFPAWTSGGFNNGQLRVTALTLP